MKIAVLVFFILTSVNIHSQTIDSMCSRLRDSIKDKKEIKLAVIDFYSINQKNADSKIIQQRITTYFSAIKEITLIERSLLDKVLGEIKLQQSGTIAEKDITKIGEITGANYVLTGTINDLKDNKLEINSRIVEVATGKIITGANAIIEKDWESISISTTPPSYSGKAITQIAILLDTSGSMDGLIEQAKRYLWSIINELSKYEKDGNGNVVEVALYEYGNDKLPRESGYIRKVLDFTKDMDAVAKELFSLKTNGGNEYCGWVIKDAVEKLKWNKKDDVYKAIFIAGNEPFTQGPINFEEAANLAKSKGIFVNTIFCGPRQQGIAQRWKDAANLTDGDYNSIDPNYIASIETPYDDKLVELNDKLNQTYIPYGGASARNKMEQKIQLDKQTLGQSKAVMAERANFAASDAARASYSSWDLITAVENGELKISEIKEEMLSDELKKMTKQELQSYILSKIKERENLRKEIEKNRVEREKYIELKQKDGPKDLGKAIIETVRNQAAKKGYKTKEKKN
ncbi:MAG: VWA domain-containing protein [Elusimicrobiota bacterium]